MEIVMAAIKLTNKKGRIVIDMQINHFVSLVSECKESIEQKCKAGVTLQDASKDLPVTTIMAGVGKALIDHMNDAPEGSKFTITV
jgi:hypothetical protein